MFCAVRDRITCLNRQENLHRIRTLPREFLKAWGAEQNEARDWGKSMPPALPRQQRPRRGIHHRWHGSGTLRLPLHRSVALRGNPRRFLEIDRERLEKLMTLRFAHERAPRKSNNRVRSEKNSGLRASKKATFDKESRSERKKFDSNLSRSSCYPLSTSAL